MRIDWRSLLNFGAAAPIAGVFSFDVLGMPPAEKADYTLLSAEGPVDLGPGPIVARTFDNHPCPYRSERSASEAVGSRWL